MHLEPLLPLSRRQCRGQGRLRPHDRPDGQSPLEGFVHHDERVMAVQFHPEAAPGPHDSRHLLSRFTRFAKNGEG